ncbi:hypothetical protein [Caldanaerobacter subterraneus]|uniref:hypothetical protein n=1 Tax=Caldanaerobacter subterraneus TaxID=911092 RepID=UPI00241E62E9|nr:hypothetical protein [Caldanaerobacter subterraneus]MDK2794448.1 hypothetical protein [Caldanaerobacter sp.]
MKHTRCFLKQKLHQRITLSANIAALAPGSRIGAAHPVSIEDDSGMSEIQRQKITHDAAAWIRSIAENRGRDPSHGESKSI